MVGAEGLELSTSSLYGNIQAIRYPIAPQRLSPQGSRGKGFGGLVGECWYWFADGRGVPVLCPYRSDDRFGFLSGSAGSFVGWLRREAQRRPAHVSRYLLWQPLQPIRVARPIVVERQATSSFVDSHLLRESAVTSAGESGPPVFDSTSEARSPPNRHPA